VAMECGSTVSTSGSFMAMSRIGDMSNPYTFSHPVCRRCGQQVQVTSTGTGTVTVTRTAEDRKRSGTVDLLVLVVRVFDSNEQYCCLVREHQSAWLQPLTPISA
jgi:hypothetical protein